MKRLVILILLFSVYFAYAQQDTTVSESSYFSKRKGNEIDIGLGGNGLILSLNYDRLLFQGKNYFTDLRIGASYFIFGYGMPVSFSVNFGRKHYIELGAGALFGHACFFGCGNFYIVYPMLGYRFQKPDGGITFRVYGLILANFVDKIYNPYAGISIGYAF